MKILRWTVTEQAPGFDSEEISVEVCVANEQFPTLLLNDDKMTTDIETDNLDWWSESVDGEVLFIFLEDAQACCACEIEGENITFLYRISDEDFDANWPHLDKLTDLRGTKFYNYTREARKLAKDLYRDLFGGSL
tara:strand:+ start:2014 stop:2418 length:405 start_codon:yes stop_codon:yes gene_type:complete